MHPKDYSRPALNKVMLGGSSILSPKSACTRKAVTGIATLDISIRSDAFLQEIQKTRRAEPALEALRKLLAGGIQSRGKTNVVQQTTAFSDRLEEAIARYHANAIMTAEVLQELINLAKDLNASRERREDMGRSDEEITFYDALARDILSRRMGWVTQTMRLEDQGLHEVGRFPLPARLLGARWFF